MPSIVRDSTATLLIASGGASTGTIGHTVGSGMSMACVAFALKGTAAYVTVSSVTFGSAGAMTLQSRGSDPLAANIDAEIWTIANPPTGASVVSFTLSGTARGLAVSQSYSGVSVSGATNAWAAVASEVTCAGNTSVVIGMMASDRTTSPFQADYLVQSIYTNVANGVTVCGYCGDTPGGTPARFGWNINNTASDSVTALVEMIAIATPASSSTATDVWAQPWIVRGDRAFGPRVRGIADTFWVQQGSARSDTAPTTDTTERAG